jgi:hypothetical protein
VGVALEGERAKTVEVTQARAWLVTEAAQAAQGVDRAPRGREGDRSGLLDSRREGAGSGGWVGSDLTGGGSRSASWGMTGGTVSKCAGGVSCDGGLRIVLRAGHSCVDGCRWAV